MEVPFYFTVKEFEEKYFEDFNKYRKYNYITLVEFLILVGKRLYIEYEDGGMELYFKENIGSIVFDEECSVQFFMLFYEGINTNVKNPNKIFYNLFNKGTREDIERFLLRQKLGFNEIYNYNEVANPNNNETDMLLNAFISLLIQIQYNHLFDHICKTKAKEEYNEELIDDKIANNNTEQDFSNNENKEKVILLEKMGIIDFIKEKQSNPNNIKQTAEILSSFTGIKSATLYSYLRPMLSPHRDDKDKNSPYKNPENLQRANKTLHKLPIK